MRKTVATTRSRAPRVADRGGDTGSWRPLVALCLGYFMVVLDVTVVTVAVPIIGRQLDASVTSLQWVVDGYTLVFAALLLSGGALGDRIGGKPVFLVGLVVFGLTSAVCGFAPNVAVLIIARLAQGIGAALLVPASLALLRAAYPDRAGRARAFGIWGSVAGIAAAAGPVLGGLLVSGLGWRWVFFLNVPVAAVALPLTARYVPAAPGSRLAARDRIGQLTGGLCLVGLVGAVNEAGRLGWSAPPVLAGFAVFALGLAGFLAAERTAAAPMLPLALFRSGEFSAATVIGLLLNIGFFGFVFAAPLYFEQVRGWSAAGTGLALLPAVVSPALVSALAGRVVGRRGPRWPATVGLVCGALGLLGWLAVATRTPYPLLAVAMFVAGLAPAIAMPASTAAIMESVPQERGGVASAVFNTARQVGSAVGVAVYGSLVTIGLVTGLRLGALLGALGFAIAAVAAAVFLSAHHRTRDVTTKPEGNARMPLYLFEAAPRNTVPNLLDAFDKATTAAGGELIECQVTADAGRVFVVIEAADEPSAIPDVLDAEAAELHGPDRVRLVGADLNELKAARPEAGYLVEWDLPADLTMEVYLDRKKANSPRYASVPEVTFLRTYVREDMAKCLCFYTADEEESVQRARAAVDAPVDRLHRLQSS